MSEKIEPALSAEEWESADEYWEKLVNGWLDTLRFEGRHDALIAIYNHALPDSDPRKITREKILELGSIIRTHEADRGADESDSLAFLDALESYLPPLTVADKAT